MGYESRTPGQSIPSTFWNDEVRDQVISQVTSTTRPASPKVGQRIYEIDTGRYLAWGGSNWGYDGYTTADSRVGFELLRTGTAPDGAAITLDWQASAKVFVSDVGVTVDDNTSTPTLLWGGLWTVTAVLTETNASTGFDEARVLFNGIWWPMVYSAPYDQWTFTCTARILGSSTARMWVNATAAPFSVPFTAAFEVERIHF